MLDISSWPLVRVTYPEVVTDDVIIALSRDLKAVLDRRERFAMVIDGPGTLALSAKHRKMIAEAVEQNAEGLKRHCVGQAIIIQSAVTRGIVTALVWLREPPAPMKLFETAEAAESWARAQLDR